MDNVTHSLAGLLLAESAVRLRAWRTGAEPASRLRIGAALSSMIAANLPDADLFYTGVGADRLTYILHHRGYTHTVVAAVLGAVLIWIVAWLALRRSASSPPSRGDARWLLGLLLVSTLSHLVLDWTNSYGVHPFWPFDDRWRYGDAVFIVEPWLWVVAVPALVAASVNRVARVLLSIVLLIGLVLAWRVDLVSRDAAIALTVGALVSIVLARMLRPGPRAAVAVSAWIAVTLVMAIGTASARAATVNAVHAADPRARLLDVVVTPLPSNAVCANVITVERSGMLYRVATARVSAAPAITDAARCGTRDRARSSFSPSTRRSTPAVRWDAEWSAPSAELATLASESCSALAALRFMRVPAWRAVDDSLVALGDVRFGGAESGFASVRVSRRSSACPPAVPPWIPPRADVLGLSVVRGSTEASRVGR
jgi:inner membrane protein